MTHVQWGIQHAINHTNLHSNGGIRFGFWIPRMGGNPLVWGLAADLREFV